MGSDVEELVGAIRVGGLFCPPERRRQRRDDVLAIVDDRDDRQHQVDRTQHIPPGLTRYGELDREQTEQRPGRPPREA